MDPPMTHATPSASSRAPASAATSIGSCNALAAGNVRPRGGHARPEVVTQPQLGAEVANHFVSRCGVTSLEAFDRKLVDHTRESRDLRELLGRGESSLQRILDGLRSGRGIGRRSSAPGERVAGVEPLSRAARLANRDHAPSGFGL